MKVAAGLEPATVQLVAGRSIQLSYATIKELRSVESYRSWLAFFIGHIIIAATHACQ